MASHYLVLYPQDPNWAAPLSQGVVETMLRQQGFLGEASAPGAYLTGPEYLGLVSYLGCSPQISLGEAEAATRIYLREATPQPCFNAGSNFKLPRCRHCRKTIAMEDTALSICPHCHEPMHPDWRRSAALARVFIEISNVYESEAVPGDTLLECLHAATGVAWDYSYLRRE